MAPSDPLAYHESRTAGRANNFGILRLVLASTVVVCHCAELMDGNRGREILTSIFGTVSSGMVAVDFFFLISGFLINKSWVSDPRLFAFLEKRVLRIYPGFIVASLISVFVVGRLAERVPVKPQALILPTLVNGAKLHYPEYPAPLAFLYYPIVNGAMWTIQGEFLCYLVAAVLGLAALTKRRWPWLIVFAVSASIMFRNDANGVGEDSSLLLAMPRFLAFFSAGALFYLYRDKVVYHRYVAVAAGCLLCFVMLFHPYAQLGLATLGAYLLFSAAFAFLPKVAYVGTKNDLSYGLYLYAWPIQQLLLLYFPSIGLCFYTFVALFFSVAMGFLSWRFVEAPLLRLKDRKRAVLTATA